MKVSYEVIVVGSGPNGLAAAITCARAGHSVLVLEKADKIGGGVRSAALTLPGFVHDVCSAFYPLGIGSPFFRSLPLQEHGLKWIQPAVPLAHPLEDGTAAVLQQNLEATAASLGCDGVAYGKLMQPFVQEWEPLLEDILAPIHYPRHPGLLARFAWRSLGSVGRLANTFFHGQPARALFAGLAAHAQQPLDRMVTGAYGLVLGLLGHAVGWPIVQGGSQNLANALGSYLRSLGGEIRTNYPVDDYAALPPARLVFFDLSPRQLLPIMGDRWPDKYRRRLEGFRYGPGAFKIDWALAGPIPWRAPACAQAGTVHLGGNFDEIAAAEKAVACDEAPPRPFVLLGQQSLFDPARAPGGQHTAWACCHVPNSCQLDMTERIEAQVERFAPGFRDRVLARNIMPPGALELYNSNYIGGDIAGGALGLDQLLARPVLRWNPYVTPAKGVCICSASTPPGGGVHGMCGYYAAWAALRRELCSRK